ncbi:MAG: tRNA epoxyqueuosine(34) reductase QueG [Roseiarcus sp.]|uniref:tRNA epoxyqueuosine(34) reductase QueG n=1 Tax=Roseiarcus sp. TaxID=1969460 RepID=UPI003BAF71C4
MVRTGEVAPVVPPAAGRATPGDGAERDLRQSRLLAAFRARAAALGFDACRVTSAQAPESARERLSAWLADGAHGDMGWMKEGFERRTDPRSLMPGARSLIMLGLNYGPGRDPLAALAVKDAGAISVYARHRDYHDVVKGKLKELAAFLVAAARPQRADVKVSVDTAPLMEKPLAARAGIGWQGKHTNLVSREFGSWLFLGAILTDLELSPDPPESDHCGACRACLDVCPTDAFPAPYRLDARRCISYLTIEHKGQVPRELRSRMGNRIYGCDDCLAVCPWNKFAKAGREAKLAARADLDSPPLAELGRLDDAGFRALFAGGPIKRIGRARFLRNVMIAIGNSGEPLLAEVARERLDDESPLVRGAAVWALAQLCSREELAGLARQRKAERDPDIEDEWRFALAGPEP